MMEPIKKCEQTDAVNHGFETKSLLTNSFKEKKKNTQIQKNLVSSPVEYCSYLLLIPLSYFQIQPLSNKEKDERLGNNERIIYLHKIKVL